MKAEVVLKRINRASHCKDEDLGLNSSRSTEEEHYSPTDFINQLNGKGSVGSRASVSPNPSTKAASSPTSSGGNVSVAQSIIRPIPIIPIDSSIYSTPPTYIDTLPIVTLPVVPSQLLGNQVQRSESVIHQQQGARSPESREPLRCQWMNCEETFTLMEDLVNHVNDYHVRVERPDVEYQCKWDGCPRRGKGFNARYKMLIHIRTHTNEKPHKCTLCGKSFSRLENLKIHNRSHTGEKPYTCPFEGCNKAYSNSSDRFKHVRTHQEDKPYICKMPGCNKRYTDPSSLRKHVRTHGHHCKTNGQTKSPQPNSPSSPQSDQGSVLSPPLGLAKLCPLSPTSLLLPVSHASSLCFTSSFSAMGFENGGLLQVPNLASNPLLSSAIISVQPQNLSTQNCKNSFTVKVSHRDHVKTSAGIEGAIDIKGTTSDCPLDLTTGPTSPTIIISTQDVEMGSPSEAGGQDGIGSTGNQWEMIQTES